MFFFFFQAEDGIRDADVTGVQTCALPIYRLFDDFTRGWPSVTREWPTVGRTSELMPNMDVVETDNEFEITAELPGCRRRTCRSTSPTMSLRSKERRRRRRRRRTRTTACSSAATGLSTGGSI